MIEKSLDINREYEKIFGSAKQVNLFDTEDEYAELRRFILEQPHILFKSTQLPFAEIRIIAPPKKEKSSNKELSRIIGALLAHYTANHVEVNADKSKHFFYIEKANVCYSKGFFDEGSGFFGAGGKVRG